MVMLCGIPVVVYSRPVFHTRDQMRLETDGDDNIFIILSLFDFTQSLSKI